MKKVSLYYIVKNVTWILWAGEEGELSEQSNHRNLYTKQRQLLYIYIYIYIFLKQFLLSHKWHTALAWYYAGSHKYIGKMRIIMSIHQCLWLCACCTQYHIISISISITCTTIMLIKLNLWHIMNITCTVCKAIGRKHHFWETAQGRTWINTYLINVRRRTNNYLVSFNKRGER